MNAIKKLRESIKTFLPFHLLLNIDDEFCFAKRFYFRENYRKRKLKQFLERPFEMKTRPLYTADMSTRLHSRMDACRQNFLKM